MPVVDVSSLTYEPIQLRDGDFSAGRDDDTALSAGTVGEIATAEVGEDGQLSGYDAVQVGQPPTNTGGDIAGNEAFVDLADSGGDVDDTSEFAIAARQKGELGGGPAGSITGWISQRESDSSTVGERPKVFPQTPVVKDGRLLQLLFKNEAAQDTAALASSTFQIPALGGK